MDETRLWRLLGVGRSLIAELDPEAILDRLLEVAQELTGARYAAIGVLDDRRERLERFLTRGIDEETHRAIGDLPHGRGVLGVLIHDPRPLRLADVGLHPESYGFPLAHPPMRSFLGVPILVHGEAWGNLYLTEKTGGEFTADDERVVTVLADWAAIAITNARLYRQVRVRNDELQRANQGLETTTEIGRALGGLTDLDRVLELVAKRARALIDARATEITLRDGDELVIAALAGQVEEVVRGVRLAISESVVGEVGGSGQARRVPTVPAHTFAYRALGARSALVAPMIFRNRVIGFLTAFDRTTGDVSFSEEDERLLQAFAASAATAVATAQTATDEALRRSLQASEDERRRWARELHDETLQDLAGLRMLLSGARRNGDPAVIADAVGQALEMLTDGIANLRALITELRPAALDELGVGPAVEALVARVQAQSSLDIELDMRLSSEAGRSVQRLVPELEAAVYRLIQEGLTNVVKHAGARHVLVRLDDDGDDRVTVEIRDDGRGFDPRAVGSGFGLIGMRERMALVHGTLDVRSHAGGGTSVVARIPVARRDPRETETLTPS